MGEFAYGTCLMNIRNKTSPYTPKAGGYTKVYSVNKRVSFNALGAAQRLQFVF
jgi:hypothetical protein